jgi:serine/threonine protein kinase
VIDEALDAMGRVSHAVDGAGRAHHIRRLAVDAPPPLRRAFAREAPRRVGLVKPGLVPTLAVGPDWVISLAPPGKPLLAWLDERAQRGGRLPPREAVALVARLAGTVGSLHTRGLVHGAIHAVRVTVDTAGRPWLDDVAMSAAVAHAAGEDDSLLRGLLGAVAPELGLGEPPTPACDVFALTALLVQLITGELPPGLPTVDQAPADLIRVCAEGLAFAAAARPADAQALGTRLQGLEPPS